MGKLTPGATYIYESPDKGRTIYARKEGTTERILIGYTYDSVHAEQELWNEIYAKRNSSPALTEAVEKCIIIYKLSEDNNDGI